MTAKRYRDPWKAIEAKTEARGECLVWTGPLHTHGYARVSLAGKRVYAHRLVWESEHGPIPAGRVIDHSCRNRACLRVGHLRLATPEQNARNLSGPKRGSGVRGVQPRKHGFMVQIQRGGVNHGHFHKQLEDAAAEAATLRATLFGEFAGQG